MPFITAHVSIQKCKMELLWKFLIILITVQLQCAYSRKYILDSDFIEPIYVSDNVDQFVIGQTEFLFIRTQTPFLEAMVLCSENYEANLAIVRDMDLAKFLSDAISETNLIMDTLWTAGVQQKNSNQWWWIRGDKREPIDSTIVQNFTYNRGVRARDRKCLSFSRNNHDEPQFRPLACRARRSVMCERPRGEIENKNSTHPGWIKIGRRYYKIYQEKVPWETAIRRCYRHDPLSMLAVVITFEDAQRLGRYLLIGRPSLENAWMGAKWMGGNYRFREEEITLSNHSDSSNYPPWRYKHVKKPGGCLLLDRHLSNITLFVEALCERERPYICFKIDENDTDAFSDIIIGDDGYRLEFIRRNFNQSCDYCKYVYRNYSAKLAEIRNKQQLYNLLYVMGENRTAVNHIWIAAIYSKGIKSKPVWVWHSDGTKIETDRSSLLNWVKNATYEREVEEENTCMSMDRENHVQAIHYGTMCRYEQNFVCHFKAADLRRLQEDEKKKKQSNFVD